MKHLSSQVFELKKLALFFAIILCITQVKSQDTLHLVYHHTQVEPHDSTMAKIDSWIKNLNGKHVDIQIIGYFHKPEFKKFSQGRVDELFLVLNRKAREQLTFESYGAKKGTDEQRTTVDIIYKTTVTPEEVAAAKAKEEAAVAKAKEEEEAAKKAEKEKEKAEKEKEKAEKAEKEALEKAEKEKEKAEKSEKEALEKAEKEKEKAEKGSKDDSKEKPEKKSKEESKEKSDKKSKDDSKEKSEKKSKEESKEKSDKKSKEKKSKD
jgi:hypothetical protein